MHRSYYSEHAYHNLLFATTKKAKFLSSNQQISITYHANLVQHNAVLSPTGRYKLFSSFTKKTGTIAGR
jgi:hypothetical protein